MTLGTIEADIRHGVDGWMLVDYELDDIASTGYFLYSRRLPGQQPEEREIARHVPCASSHKGWRRPVRGDDALEASN